MFTGIIEAVGKISSVKKLKNGLQLTVDCNRSLKLRKGDSLAVDGVCLTCEQTKQRHVQFTLSTETVSRSRFAALRQGSRVNLERPLPAKGRLGGHFVQGHVDGIATVAALEEDPPGWILSVDLPQQLVDLCVEKGSISVNGVSLTVAGIRGNRIWIALIPYTWEHTNLCDLRPGDPVNIENDILAKYVMNLLRPAEGRTAGEEFLWNFVKEGESVANE